MFDVIFNTETGQAGLLMFCLTAVSIYIYWSLRQLNKRYFNLWASGENSDMKPIATIYRDKDGELKVYRHSSIVVKQDTSDEERS